MRLPNYLQLAPSGVWHFRQRVPADLLHIFKRKFVKHSLRTRDVLASQRLALALADRYARLIEQARGMRVSGREAPSVESILRSDLGKYKLIRRPGCTIELEANGEADHAPVSDTSGWEGWMWDGLGSRVSLALGVRAKR